MFCTFLFGSLPLIVRFIIAFAAPSDSDIDWFSLADLAFLGIMINIASINSITNCNLIGKNVLFVFTAASIGLIVLFVAVYAVSVLPGFKLCFPTFICLLLLLASFWIALAASDTDTLLWWQRALDNADHLDNVTGRHERAYVYGFMVRGSSNEEMDIDEETKKRDNAIAMDKLEKTLQNKSE